MGAGAGVVRCDQLTGRGKRRSRAVGRVPLSRVSAAERSESGAETLSTPAGLARARRSIPKPDGSARLAERIMVAPAVS
jgi:hypothetical protein